MAGSSPAMTFLEFDRLSPTLSSLRSDVPPHKGEGEIPLTLTLCRAGREDIVSVRRRKCRFRHHEPAGGHDEAGGAGKRALLKLETLEARAHHRPRQPEAPHLGGGEAEAAIVGRIAHDQDGIVA